MGTFGGNFGATWTLVGFAQLRPKAQAGGYAYSIVFQAKSAGGDWERV